MTTKRQTDRLLGASMSDSDLNRNRDRFQFPLRALLLVFTAACIMFGLLAMLLPKALTIGTRIAIYVVYTLMFAYAVWAIVQAKRRQWAAPKEVVTVQVDAKWKRRVHSPLIFLPIAALTGVSVTFAPLYLLWCSQVAEFGIVEWIGVPLCFLMIYFVPGLYMSLASEVIAELRKGETSRIST
jgi:hypothetical protein